MKSFGKGPFYQWFFIEKNTRLFTRVVQCVFCAYISALFWFWMQFFSFLKTSELCVRRLMHFSHCHPGTKTRRNRPACGLEKPWNKKARASSWGYFLECFFFWGGVPKKTTSIRSPPAFSGSQARWHSVSRTSGRRGRRQRWRCWWQVFLLVFYRVFQGFSGF